MNLGQLSTAVGQRLGVNTSSASTTDGAAVRSFLTIRHDQLYRAYLWKDSIVEFETSVNPQGGYTPTSNYMPTKSRVVLPPIIAHVLGVRLGWRSLNVQRPMFYYRADYARFFKMGYTAQFALLSACVWEFDTVQQLGLTNSNATDYGQSITLDELASDEVTVTRNLYPLAAGGVPVTSSDRVDNFIKPATQGTVTLGIATPSMATLNTTGIDYNFEGHANALIPNLVVGTTYTFTAGVNEVNATFANGATEYGPLNNGNAVTFTAAATNIVVQSGTAVNNPFTAVITYPSGAIINPSIITLSASQTNAPLSQRIQLVGRPCTPQQQSDNLHVLGKRTVPPYVADTDLPGIPGLTGILFALAYYDFKQRDEAGGSSDALTALNEAVGPLFLKQGTAGGFLGKLIEEEVVQGASNTRIIPADGFGDEGGYRFPDKSDPYCF